VADKLLGDIFSGPVSEEFCFLNENWPSDKPFCTTKSMIGLLLKLLMMLLLLF